MKRLITPLLSVLIATTALATDMAAPALVPQPAKMERQEGAFQLRVGSRIVTDAVSQATGEQLAARLRRATGYPLEVLPANPDGQPANGDIVLTTREAKAGLGSEGYELVATKDSVVIRASEQGGMFYGVQTLLQLLPPQVFAASAVKDAAWTVPCVTIEDQPRFGWRGLMLDVSRHFYSREEVKRYLDNMALHKLNRFHWHLVDDNGWRIEIKKYPRLTEVGAWRSDIGFGLDPKDTTAYGKDGRYGGFYTQDDIREVVAYAAKLHITVVPEIEMPGHSIAALAAYPQFSCTGKPQSTDIGAGVHAGVYCAGKDATFDFLKDVLAEVIPLFPGKYIHIGGDEVPKDNWKKCDQCQACIKANGLKNEHELQSHFIRRIEKIINAQGRSLMGWSEIREGGLAESAALMDWIGGGAESAASGHDVVMSPTSHSYFDYYQSRDTANEPKAIGGFLPLKVVYNFEPMPAKLAPELRHHILGGQGNLWTEYIPNAKRLDYMTYPRACALAEVVWSPKESRDWASFQERLVIHQQRLDQLGVNYRPNRPETKTEIGGWKPAQIKAEPAPLEWDVTTNVTAAGKSRVSLDYTKGAHGIDIAWVALIEDGREVSRDTHAGFTGSNPRQPAYTLDVPVPKPGARYTIRAQVAGGGGTDSSGTVNWEVLKTK